MGEKSRRKRDLRLCYLCLKGFTEADPPTADHVVPEGWFPKPYPRDLPTAKAHRLCQSTLSESEELLRNLFVRSEGHEQGIFDELLKRSERGRPVPVTNHALQRDTLGRLLATPVADIPSDAVQAVFNKITRGLYFKHYKRFLPIAHPLRATAVSRREADNVTRALVDSGTVANHIGEALAWAAVMDDVRGPEHGYWFYLAMHTQLVVVGTGVCADTEFEAGSGLLLRTV